MPDAPVIGAYWTRSNDVEVDLVGADREPVAGALAFLGSIKWCDGRPADVRDLADLFVARRRVPGAHDETPLVIASRHGGDAALSESSAVTVLDAEDLLHAWAT